MQMKIHLGRYITSANDFDEKYEYLVSGLLENLMKSRLANYKGDMDEYCKSDKQLLNYFRYIIDDDNFNDKEYGTFEIMFNIMLDLTEAIIANMNKYELERAYREYDLL